MLLASTFGIASYSCMKRCRTSFCKAEMPCRMSLLYSQEKITELRSPFVSVILLHPVQFSQKMNVTEGVAGQLIFEI